MDMLTDSIAFVKQQIEYQDRRATITRTDNKKLHFHMETASRFRHLLHFLEELKNSPHQNAADLSGIDPTGSLSPKELLGLPQELIDELISGGGIDKQEFLIIQLIDDAGGMLTLNRIQIGIYKHTGEIVKRANLTAKIYRMVQNGMLYRVPKKKGVYTTDATLGDSTAEEES